ncbi:thioesterase II family protein [Streptomyces sp. NPDC001435]|uniref:thioesterase II family protein n=1 Tax=unclassified Streptomyces TaxID=2593676 RepID=UPI0036A81C76
MPYSGRRQTSPVTCLIGDDDPKVSVEEAAAWSGHTDGPFTLNVFPGGHFFLAQHQTDIVRLMATQLEAPDRP